MEQVALEKMFKAHAAIKAKRAKLAKEFNEADSELKHKVETIETALLKVMNETGSDQLKVKGVGVAFRTEKLLPSANDWGALFTHIHETNNFDLMQRRLAVGGVKDYMSDHDGKTPPGVSVSIERGVSVRRQT